MFHGVGDDSFPEKLFVLQIKYLSTLFDTYWASELPELLEGRFKNLSNKPPVVLTFDDGLKNNAEIVAPILKQFGLKATFFIISDLLDGSSMMWNHEIRCRLELMENEERRIFIDKNSKRQALSITQFIDSLKESESAIWKKALQSLRELNPNPDYTADMLLKYRVMSEQDLLDLPDCIEIGSHTCTHPILDVVDDDVLRQEIVESKYALEKILKKPVTTFCYPNGNFNTKIVECVAKYYTLAVNSTEGFATKSDSYYQLSRINTSKDINTISFRLLRPRS